MKNTLMQRGAATAFPVSAGEWCRKAPTAAPVQGTAVSAAARVRHTGDAFALDAVVLGTALLNTAVDAAPPPRGAPV